MRPTLPIFSVLIILMVAGLLWMTLNRVGVASSDVSKSSRAFSQGIYIGGGGK